MRLGQIRKPSGVSESVEVEGVAGESGVHPHGDVERGAAERGGDERVAFEEEEVGPGGEDERGVDGAGEGVDGDDGEGGCGRGASGGAVCFFLLLFVEAPPADDADGEDEDGVREGVSVGCGGVE